MDAEFYVFGKGFAYPSGCKRGGRSESIYAITAFIQAGIGGSLTLLQTKKRCILPKDCDGCGYKESYHEMEWFFKDNLE